MLKTAAVSLSILALALCLWAAAPLATISASQPFELNGATVPMAGVPSWPVTAGDVIATRSAPVTLAFRDGSRVILDEQSKAKVDAKGEKPVFRLLQGSGAYNVATHPALSVFIADREVKLSPTNGKFTTMCGDPGHGGGNGRGRGGDDHGGHNPKPPCPSPWK